MQNLQATSIKRFQPLMLARRFVSFILFGCLLCAGWIALSYFKNNVSTQRNLITPATNLATSANSANKQADNSSGIGIYESNSATPLVYLLPSDKEYFHSLKHVPANIERLGLCEDAAIQRGLKPCPTCFSQ